MKNRKALSNYTSFTKRSVNWANISQTQQPLFGGSLFAPFGSRGQSPHPTQRRTRSYKRIQSSRRPVGPAHLPDCVSLPSRAYMNTIYRPHHVRMRLDQKISWLHSLQKVYYLLHFWLQGTPHFWSIHQIRCIHFLTATVLPARCYWLQFTTLLRHVRSCRWRNPAATSVVHRLPARLCECIVYR